MLSQFCIFSNSRQTNWASGRGAIIMSVSCCGVRRLNQSFLYGFKHQVLSLLLCDKSHNLPDINRWSTTLALMLDISFQDMYCYCYVGTLDTHRSVASAQSSTAPSWSSTTALVEWYTAGVALLETYVHTRWQFESRCSYLQQCLLNVCRFVPTLRGCNPWQMRNYCCCIVHTLLFENGFHLAVIPLVVSYQCVDFMFVEVLLGLGWSSLSCCWSAQCSWAAQADKKLRLAYP